MKIQEAEEKNLRPQGSSAELEKHDDRHSGLALRAMPE